MLQTCEAASAKGATDMGGLQCFDADLYRQEMEASKRYECLVVVGSVAPMSFVHKSLPPSLGAWVSM